MMTGRLKQMLLSVLLTCMVQQAVADDNVVDNDANGDRFLQPQQIPVFKALTSDSFKAELSANALSLITPLVGKTGPFIIEKRHWWDHATAGEGPSLVMGIDMPRVSNVLDVDLGEVEIAYVLGKDGYNYYDKNHPDEQSDFVRKLHFSAPYLWGDAASSEEIAKIMRGPLSTTRNIRLIKAAREENIAGIGGRIILHVPLDVESHKFAVSQVGTKRETVHGKTVQFDGHDQMKIAVSYNGAEQDLLQIIGRLEGKALNVIGSSVGTFLGTVTQNVEFADRPDEIEVYVVKKRETLIYPFVIGQRPTQGDTKRK